MKAIGDNARGVGFLVLGMLIFSLQDIAVKWIGGDYSVLEIVLVRSLVAIPFTLVFFRLEGKRGLPTTRLHTLEYLRGLCFFLSFTFHFMGVAAMPLADVASIRFSAPLMITILSVVFLSETVGPRRWLALIVGFLGVLLIVQPGSSGFNLGSIFILLDVLFYALSVIITRRLRAADSSATMAYFSSLVYLVATLIVAPVALWVGEIPNAHPSLAFLLHSWTMPTLLDGLIMVGLGLLWAGGIVVMARAYSLALASVAAPFEYVSLPISAMWGFLLWHEVPTWATWAGAALTVLSGLYILSLERQARVVALQPTGEA